MANYSQRAEVIVSLNGKQAQQMLSDLGKRAETLRTKIDAATKAGDKASFQRYSRELRQVDAQLRQLRSASATVSQTLQRLDRATPRELNKALRTLKTQLNGIERGSAAWDAHVAKIRAVRAELDRVNSTLRTQQTGWQRFTSSVTGGIAGLGAGMLTVTGAIAGARAAINSFMEIDSEMANVRKFTGMTAGEVDSLNERFKEIDTRSSRAQLNQLAQEAGRLGKTSEEDVLGFVRAADKINVALDDLGEGATLTLSKLTGIFGDEKRLGTEKALLAVGSVINELSQNCSASAPYLAEFASRLGGVSKQAGMTIQQVMAFGAVLDTQNLNVEAASTALQQVMVRLLQEPEKYARVAGLEVKKFSDLVRTDMNAALIELLSTLSEAGGMDKLSPMFADMGEKGARSIATLSALAGHIDEVKAQQIVANQAFAEATSIDQEFAVQNSTAAANVDKRKKALVEEAIVLGRQLYPALDLVYRSGTVLAQVLGWLVSFVTNNIGVILSLAAAWGAYTAAVHAATIKTALHTVVTTAGTAAKVAAKSAVLLLAAAKALLTGNTDRATAAMIRFNAVTKLNPVGLLVAAVTAAIGLLIVFSTKLKAAASDSEILARAQKKIADATKQAEANSAAEIKTLDSLYAATQNQNLAMDQRLKAAAALQRQYPDYFKNLTKEAILAGQAADAYDRLRQSIIRQAKAEAYKSLLTETEKKILETPGKIRDYLKDTSFWSGAKGDTEEERAKNAVKLLNAAVKAEGSLGGSATRNANKINEMVDDRREAERTRDLLTQSIANLAVTDAVETSTEEESGGGGGGSDHNKNKNKDRFKAEKEWREREEARSIIAWRTGEQSYADHLDRMDDIASEYYDRILARTDLTETERLTAQKDAAEAEAQARDRWRAENIEEEKAFFEEEKAVYTQFYIDGKISRDTYNKFLEMKEEAHLKRMVELTGEGSKEREAAEKALADFQIKQGEKRRKELEEAEKKIAEANAAIKSEYFGDNATEREAGYNAAMEVLDRVYAQELAATAGNEAEKLRITEAYEKAKLALRKKYALEGVADGRNLISDFGKWLESDGGKALTGSMSTVINGMGAIFQQLTSYMQAELEIQTAAIEKRYDTEIDRAEDNSYRVKMLEKQKEAEIAKAKNEANRKMFAMQVIQAVAQTAQNALAAYGSAASIPVVGYILAPIAAAMATAAGAIQIASIKKQQQASAAQGYAEGGFTRPGRRDEPAGIVHAGEWVASQQLVNSPVARPMIDALEYAQRTNSVASLSMADVSRTVTAPVALVARSRTPATVIVRDQPERPASDPRLADTLDALTRRLNAPFVTVNSVTGDHGYKQAEDEYQRLIRNKSPKTRK